MAQRIRIRDYVAAKLKSWLTGGQIQIKGEYTFKAYNADGSLKWEDKFENLVVNNGLDHILDIVLKLNTQATAWYVGLKAAGSVVAGDTMASHGGWTEITAYDEANRPQWVGGALSAQSVDNSGSPAAFTIDTNGTTIAGAFLVSTNNKGGSSGTLFSAGDFASAKTLDDNEVLEVTVKYTISSN